MKQDQNVRRLTFDVLCQAQLEGATVAELLPKFQERLRDPRDRRLLYALTVGVTRRGLTLERLLRKLTRRRLKKLDANLLLTLKIAAYQLIFLDKIPMHAAVDEAVRLTRSPRLKGFANGVLRELCRLIVQRGVESSALRVHNPRQRLMLDDGRVTVFSQPLLPSPRHRVRFLSFANSLPEGLIERWLARYEKADLEDVLEACNSLPPMFLRPNRLRVSPEALLEQLRQAGIEARRELSGALRLATPHDPRELPGFEEGLFYVQDKTAQEIAARLPVEPGQRVLDLCAAPGGKATALAERMQDQGELWAVDNAPPRLAKVRENALRLRLRCVRTEPWPSEALDGMQGAFDAVLVDVPCSNTGVLRRRHEARRRFDVATLPGLVSLQIELLQRALGFCRPGGHVLYATCSLESEENRGAVDAVLGEGMTLLEDGETLPEPDGGDGGYFALLRKA